MPKCRSGSRRARPSSKAATPRSGNRGKNGWAACLLIENNERAFEEEFPFDSYSLKLKFFKVEFGKPTNTTVKLFNFYALNHFSLYLCRFILVYFIYMPNCYLHQRRFNLLYFSTNEYFLLKIWTKVICVSGEQKIKVIVGRAKWKQIMEAWL